MNEAAVYNKDIEKELRETLADLRHCIQYDFPKASFKSKMSRLWIQNYIDESLTGKFGEFLVQSQASKTQFGENLVQFASVIQKLLRMIDVLFYFEQRKRDTNLPPQPTFFQKDIRGWIVHIYTCLYWAGSYSHHRHLLLHILRTPGIGQWAPMLVQFPAPLAYSQEYMDHYLICLGAFFGPVEELQEQLATTDLQKSMLRLSLKTLQDEGDWIVVPEVVFEFSVKKTDPVTHMRSN